MTKPKEAYTVKSHFEGKAPVVRKIYDRLLKVAKRFGPVEEDPKKTSIHLNNVTAFAGVATRSEYLILTLKSDHPITSSRIHKTDRPSTRRYHHDLKIALPDEVDAELIGWLKEAYELSG